LDGIIDRIVLLDLDLVLPLALLHFSCFLSDLVSLQVLGLPVARVLMAQPVPSFPVCQVLGKLRHIGSVIDIGHCLLFYLS